jgi:hypothetical protein
MGTPSEQVGFQASEEYTSRMSSPRPVSASFVAHSNASDTHVDSPLKKESTPLDATGKADFEGTLSRSLDTPSDTALSSTSEVEDDDVIHVDDPERRSNKIYGGDNKMQSAEDLGIHTEIQDDDDPYSAPILAADVVAKEPFGWELLPAVSPQNDRRGNGLYDDTSYHHRSGSATSTNGSRPSSRPSSIHGAIPGLKLPESTPLEDLAEYEPLFPEDDKKSAGIEKSVTAVDKLKRPELKNRKFPSQDIWEDTPNSLQYTATVSTPQLPEDTEDSPVEPKTETAAQAFARRQEELAERESLDSQSFLHQEKKPWAHKAHLATETRPVMKQRFPSRDIWEDTPDSLQLETTVAGPQSDEQEAVNSPLERSAAGAAVDQPEKSTAELSLGPEEGRPAIGISAISKPQIPARPVKSKPSEFPEKAQPVVPERPQRMRQLDGAGATPPMPAKNKPQVPARPSKPVTRESSENIPLSTVPSNSSTKSLGSETIPVVAAAKPKPPIPSRPMGSKIAALQGGFMADLNKRLQLGAQPPKKEEPAPEEKEEEKEKVPLVDARKGRARGPARRAPAKSPAPVIAETPAPVTSWSFSTPVMSWEIDPEDDFVHVITPGSEKASFTKPSVKAIEAESPILDANAASESLHDSAEISVDTTKASSLPSADKEDTPQEEANEVEKSAKVEGTEKIIHTDELVKSDESSVVPANTYLLPENKDEEEDMSASTATLKPKQDSE